MKLSALQKFILKQSYGGKKIHRLAFSKFYNNKPKVPKGEDMGKIITKSLERLIAKGLIVGYGEITKEKWYIKEIQLTVAGRNVAKKLLGEQVKLPFKITEIKHQITNK